MKRNVFVYESSDEEEPEVKKTKKLVIGPKMGSKTESLGSNLPFQKDRSNFERDCEDFSSESDVDYMSMELRDELGSRPSGPPKRASVNIPMTNSIGLKMMERMGFKLGDTLGAQNSAITEPIAIKVKMDRKGIGATRMPDSVAYQHDEYRLTAKDRHIEAKNKKYLVQLQRFCFHQSGDDVSISEGMDVEEVNLLWRKCAREMLVSTEGRKLLFGEKQVDLEAESKGCHERGVQATHQGSNHQEKRTDQAQRKYQVELVKEDEQVHQDEHCVTNSKELETPLSESLFKSLSITEQLHRLISYTRDTFFYCPYCSVQYKNKEDMQNGCPGPYENDHAELL